MKIIPDSVVIGYPHLNSVTEGFARSLAEACLTQENRIVNILATSSARQEYSRNITIEKFLEGSDGLAGEWLMWIDTDMVFDRDAIARLVATAKKTGADMATALGFVYKREENKIIPNAWTFDKEEQKFVEVETYEPGRIYEIDGTGTGFLLVNRKVFGSYKDSYWHQSRVHPSTGRYMGHDLAFCYDTVVEGNFKLVWDTSIKTGHIKHFEITEENYRASRGLT